MNTNELPTMTNNTPADPQQELQALREALREKSEEIKRRRENDKLDIPFDVKHLQNHEWPPEPKYMSPDAVKAQQQVYDAAESLVIIDNTRVSWDSCDCGDGYGCSHGSWPYEIKLKDQEKVSVDFEDDGLVFIGTEYRQINISHQKFTMNDFVRFCELVGIKLIIRPNYL